MSKEQLFINQAFESCLKSSLSASTRDCILAHFGEPIASKVVAIYNEAMSCPVDWHTATMDSALIVLHDFLSNNYPWLSVEARRNINTAFIMEWK